MELNEKQALFFITVITTLLCVAIVVAMNEDHLLKAVGLALSGIGLLAAIYWHYRWG